MSNDSHGKRKLETMMSDEHDNEKVSRSEACFSTKKDFDESSCKLFTDNDLCNLSDYYFENGLRKVYPYYYVYRTWCKGRWLGLKINDVYSKEFRGLNEEKLSVKLKEGSIKVNKQMIGPDYVLKDNDLITCRAHRHEMPVIGLPIKIIHDSNDILVIDKPPSIPIHGCGAFLFNSVLYILRKEHKYKNIFPVHRLDRLTSGILLFTKSQTKAKEIVRLITDRKITKEYICKVEGVFPDKDVEVNQPLYRLCPRIGVHIINKLGKESITIFRKISDDGKNSIVKCLPKTGRTHQIRVHLQYLGYPILNDPLYNSTAFGENKGKNADYGTTNFEELKNRILDNHPNLWKASIDMKNSEIMSFESKRNSDEIKKLSEQIQTYISNEWKEYMLSKKFDPAKVTKDDACDDCNVIYRDPFSHNLLIYLHAVRYKSDDWDFKTDMPFWAK